LALGAVTEREDACDVFLPHPGKRVYRLADLPHGAAVATGSLRRRCQLLHLRPDLRVMDLRGNLHTRYARLESSEWAGMVLARAGVVRLGWAERIGEVLDPLVMLPAVGQGALGIEVRGDDRRLLKRIQALHHTATAAATTAERSLLRELEGGCQVPIGTYGRLGVDQAGKSVLILDALVGSLDGTLVVRDTLRGSPEEAGALGAALARRLLALGARQILDQIRSTSDS
jgi:hydroxymethylbilane synthase